MKDCVFLLAAGCDWGEISSRLLLCRILAECAAFARELHTAAGRVERRGWGGGEGRGGGGESGSVCCAHLPSQRAARLLVCSLVGIGVARRTYDTTCSGSRFRLQVCRFDPCEMSAERSATPSRDYLVRHRRLAYPRLLVRTGPTSMTSRDYEHRGENRQKQCKY